MTSVALNLLGGRANTTRTVSGLVWLPSATWTTANNSSTVSRSTINDVASNPESRQAQVSADNAPIRVVYGRDRIGAQLANFIDHANHWIMQCVWCEGEIDDIESITIDNKSLAESIHAVHYAGTVGQPVDPWLAAAFAAKGISYSDALPGIAYSVLRIPASIDSLPQVAAVIRGRKLYDPRTGLTAWSQNAALALADFLTSPLYGAGRAIDWSSVGTAADACDELVGGEPRRTIGVTIAEVRNVDQHIDVLRTYAGCFVLVGDTGMRLVPDRPAAVSRSYNHNAGEIESISTLRKRAVTDAPTVVTVRYTDTSEEPWRDAPPMRAYAPGVLAGTTPRRESEVSLPGIHSASQAMREAIERLNKQTLSDLSFDLSVFDESISIEPGDVVAVTHPVGLSAKPMRVVDVSGADGRYTLSMTEYDPAAYSDVIETDPTHPDTSLPDPGAPGPVTGLALVEEVFQQQDGTFSSRLRATWAAPAFLWIDHYRINVVQNADVVQTGTAPGNALTWASAAIQEGLLYKLEVITVSRTGGSSIAASGMIESLGKQLPPGNVPSVTGFEVGGEVRLAWEPAVDIDIWRYEIRYGISSDTWDEATLVDRTDSLRLVTADIPVGTWDFMVKALDSVGHYSPTEARRSITVTLDSGAFLVDVYEFDAPTVSGMAEFRLGRLDTLRRWVTENGATVASKFTAALTSYTLPMAAYNSGASTWNSEVEDFGLVLAGNWRAEANVSNVIGSHGEFLDVSSNGSAWTAYPMVAKTSGRFARMRLTAASGSAMYVQSPGNSVRIDAVPRKEDGEGTSAAAGPRTITLANAYAAVKSLSIVPLGTASRSYAIDNIIVGSPTKFDVYLFNPATGAQVAGGFRWAFEGV